MRINKNQEDILQSFTCERFRENSNNFDLMKEFKSDRGEALVDYLVKIGFNEEYDNQTAYYIIKNNYGKPLMFFSLKCGALFEPLEDPLNNKDFQRVVIILQAIINSKSNPEDAKKATELIDEFMKEKNMDLNEAIKLISRKKQKSRLIDREKEKEENDNILRVLCVHPGIELMHFCTNDLMKDYWKGLGMSFHKMGEVLFWYFVVPTFSSIQKLVGCEYAFLFAADASEDGSLVNYYENVLKFKKKMDVGTNKPFYDFACEFMCQEVNQLLEQRNIFFSNFNDDITDAV